MLQAHAVRRGGLPRRAVPRPSARPARRQRPAVADPARGGPGDPRRLPRCRRRHHLDQLLHVDADRPGRLRARPEVVRDINVAAARLARDAADAAERADPGRPRFVAGALGPTNRTASISPDVGDPAARGRHLGRARGRLPRGGRRSRRGRRRHPAHRDDLRHAQRQGRDLRGRDAVRRARRAAAGDHLGHDRRRLRADAVRPDGRGVLAQHPPRRSARRRAQLRARPEAAPRASRRPVAGRRPPGVGLPERRPAQRARRLRRDAGGDGRRHSASGRPRPAQRRRRLLRHDAGRTSRRSRPAVAGLPPRPIAEPPRRDPPVRARAGRHPAARQHVRQHRRADQRHRLAQVRPAHRRGAARTRRSTSPASRSPTAPSSSTSTWTRRCSTASRR